MKCLALIGLVLTLSVQGSQARTDTSPAEALNAAPYFPLAVGNEWTYTLANVQQHRASSITWKVTQTEQEQGHTAFYLLATPPDGDEPFVVVPSSQGVREGNSERIFVKAAKAGARWSNTDTALNHDKTVDSFRIVTAETPCTVAGHAFAQCITIREDNESMKSSSETIYAKEVGPVEYKYFDWQQPDKIRTTLTIKSWKVKQTS